MNETAAARDRALGCFLGLAVGDALGTTVEFRQRGTFAPVTDMVGGGPFRLQPGQWTDDTSLALCLAESLLHDPALDPADFMTRCLRWYRHGENSSTGTCFDIGAATRAALARFEATGDPMAGDPSPNAAGNGSVMRLAPVAVRHWRTPRLAEAVAERQSACTHATPVAVSGCALLSEVLCGLLAGRGAAALTPRGAKGWPPRIRAIAGGKWRGLPVGAISSSGYVVHTLEAAMWAVDGAKDFREAVLRAVNLGDDADTVGAVAGMVAGAQWGLSGIPPEWRERLHDAARLQGLAEALWEAGAG
ncbi:ADP-ribosylglycohydrolase family protein [Roseococcus sp. DSY-14]|uniref:ADP-ribosylglycohydrolase family protein n=1 Tax=Roseococcus sp. DSY-14 TaxID=3369650 RepID=UPI00387AA2C3